MATTGSKVDAAGVAVSGAADRAYGPFVRSPYNYDVMRASNESGLQCLDVSLAVQSERDEVDINTIVRRFGLTGRLPDNIRLPQYGDFTGITDYQTALNAVMAADDEFMELPADLRARFDNDPARFVDFCLDEKNREELQRLGLLKPLPVEPEPIKVRVMEADKAASEKV